MDYDNLRNRMVEEQLMPRSISDEKVLAAFRSVKRHEFIPTELQDASYNDHPLPIGENQTISQPYMVALMTESLNLKGNETVLEIGTGSGYQAAILATLVKKVYSVERVEVLAKRAEATLKKLGYDNVEIKLDDGTLGWEEHAPYDGIIVTAAAPKIPDAYIRQLKVNGKLIIPVGAQFSQVLTVVHKGVDKVSTSDLCGCVFVPLVGRDGWRK